MASNEVLSTKKSKGASNLMTKINVITLVKTLKTNAKYGFPKLILGGPDVTYNCENYLKTGADFLIIGEGEQTTLELESVNLIIELM